MCTDVIGTGLMTLPKSLKYAYFVTFLQACETSFFSSMPFLVLKFSVSLDRFLLLTLPNKGFTVDLDNK